MMSRFPSEMNRMNYDTFVREVAERAGIPDRTEAERAVMATIEALGRRLREVDARAVANELPTPLANVLLRSSRGDECSLADFERNLANRAPAPLIRAACQVLAESLDEQGRTQLRIQPLTRLFH